MTPDNYFNNIFIFVAYAISLFYSSYFYAQFLKTFLRSGGMGPHFIQERFMPSFFKKGETHKGFSNRAKHTRTQTHHELLLLGQVRFRQLRLLMVQLHQLRCSVGQVS